MYSVDQLLGQTVLAGIVSEQLPDTLHMARCVFEHYTEAAQTLGDIPLHTHNYIALSLNSIESYRR